MATFCTFIGLDSLRHHMYLSHLRIQTTFSSFYDSVCGAAHSSIMIRRLPLLLRVLLFYDVQRIKKMDTLPLFYISHWTFSFSVTSLHYLNIEHQLLLSSCFRLVSSNASVISDTIIQQHYIVSGPHEYLFGGPGLESHGDGLELFRVVSMYYLKVTT